MLPGRVGLAAYQPVVEVASWRSRLRNVLILLSRAREQASFFDFHDGLPSNILVHEQDLVPFREIAL